VGFNPYARLADYLIAQAHTTVQPTLAAAGKLR
jgi:hypothetical protein